MIALKTIDVRSNFREVSRLVFAGEKVLISRPRNENLVILSEQEYNELERIRRNNEYLAKIDGSIQEFKQGKVVMKTMEELEEMAR